MDEAARKIAHAAGYAEGFKEAQNLTYEDGFADGANDEMAAADELFAEIRGIIDDLDAKGDKLATIIAIIDKRGAK